MEKLKCESCGANLEIDENKEYATCPYCNLKYKLKKDNNLNIKLELDEDTKETIKKGGKTLLKLGISHFIIVSTIAIIVIGGIIFGIVKLFNTATKTYEDTKKEIRENKTNDSSSDNNLNEYDSMKQKIEVSSFNSKYELYSGKQNKHLLKTIFDSVATNNSKNIDKKITIVCSGVHTSDPEEITDLYDKLEDKEYEIKLDYDDNGYVNKITII